MQDYSKLPDAPRAFGFHLDGAWVPKGSRDWIERTSPAHGVRVTRVVHCTLADLESGVRAARRAFRSGVWSEVAGAARAGVLLKAASGIRARLDEIAYWETLETGKPISQSRSEIGGAADHYEYAAGVARTLKGDAFNNLGPDMMGFVTRQPIGVIGLITPWNFPFIILAERIPYMLAAGCVIVAKPSEFTSASTLIMAEILTEAGLPKGVFNVVTGYGADIGQAMTEHEDIDVLSFTGSIGVGRKVLLASASNLKKLSLELGGKNPQIVFADADLEDAADGIVFGLLFNAGQCCVSGSRLIVERSVAGRLEELLRDKFDRVRLGDPLDPKTQVGAMVTPEHMKKVLGYVQKGIEEGATLAHGGQSYGAPCVQFVQPTLLTGVRNDMTVARDEIFGPILTMIEFDTLDEAVEIANDNILGLAASIWTKDLDKAMKTMRRVEAGRTWVNTTIAGGPELPIGGFKQSGSGRETGVYGVEEYTELKSIHIALGKREHWVG
ncbi:MAG: aldehyde dehydrogenase family protein [Rhodospirillum sp.]|nr:aldehyde dehydrogenase family protein [Rhodospirillum sp.]MCF8489451.1 aldehyde dehydrogenase family protein [Rhodospirillum sp.]MCF8500965.1 aldehyde dehydrogenase family protein [Rhodospirillum sp.]